MTSAPPGSRVPVLAVLGFMAAVHVIADCGNGRLGSPSPSGWSPTDAAAGVGNVAFFPLYPLLVKAVSLAGVHFSRSGGSKIPTTSVSITR